MAEYYPVESVTPLPEPRPGVRVSMHAGSDEWLARLVLSLGGDAVVTNRPEASDMVARRAEQALAAYE